MFLGSITCIIELMTLSNQYDETTMYVSLLIMGFKKE